MNIISILQFFGITSDKPFPLVIVIRLSFYLFYHWCIKSIKISVEKINKDLTCVNNATTELQSHLLEAGYKILHPITMKPGSLLVLAEYGQNY